MYAYGHHFSEQDQIIAGYHGTEDGTLPIAPDPTADRPDWVITSAPDFDPMTPDGDYFPYFIVVDGINRVDSHNHEWAPWVSPTDEVMAAIHHFDDAGLDWRDVLPRFFRIFHDQEVAVFDGGDTFEYIAMPSQKWREAVGAYLPANEDDSFHEWRAYHNGEMEVWTLWEWSERANAYAATDTLHNVAPAPTRNENIAYAINSFLKTGRLTTDHFSQSELEDFSERVTA